MKFKTFQLIIDGHSPQNQDIIKISNQGNEIFHQGSELFEIEKSIIEDRFLWLSCQYDNSELYNEEVWNEDENKKEDNPRKNLKSNVETNCLSAMIWKSNCFI